jgi:beta-lactamase regulating signal transducer with metallopeptidase domain/peptidoglycan/xylan/chitin deacetylase (PgdA/CDA1 family)
LTTLESIAGQEAIQATGWALVHSFWQVSLVAAVYACFSALTRARASNVRYAGAVVAMALMLLLPLATASLALSSPRGLFTREEISSEGTWTDSVRDRTRAERGIRTDASTAPHTEAQSTKSSALTLRAWAEGRLEAFVPWLAFAWVLCVVALASRLVGGWLLLLRLRRSAVPVNAGLEELLARVARRVRVARAVRLCRSALVEVPTVIGHLRPIILIPASVITGLTPQQLEAVLAHELAHIRRYDYLVNLLQTAAEVLLFYHPAMWWLSRRVRAEREHACDDAAVEGLAGDVLLYARALAALEALRARGTHASALALAADGGSLMQRIQRLVRLNQTHTHSNPRTPLVAAALLVVLTCGALACARALMPSGANSALESNSSRPSSQRREVAVTFVNFPGNNIYSIERLNNKTHKLMRSLAANDIKSVAFVNEARLYKDDGTVDDARVLLLREWLDAGHELGNETFNHQSLYTSTVAEFEAEVEQGEKIMSKLLAERGGRMRYFSYPYLNTGASAQDKAAVEKYLNERGYSIHPVTIDNMDWIFNKAYIEALRREDDATAARIRAEYVPYMERMFEFFEAYSREVVGREIPQVLMLTGGALNADCFDELASMLKRRGYAFVTLEQATRDDAYNLPDTYTGSHGDSWIARWAATKGMPYKDVEEENLGAYMQQYFSDYVKQQQAKRMGGGKK